MAEGGQRLHGGFLFSPKGFTSRLATRRVALLLALPWPKGPQKRASEQRKQAERVILRPALLSYFPFASLHHGLKDSFIKPSPAVKLKTDIHVMIVFVKLL